MELFGPLDLSCIHTDRSVDAADETSVRRLPHDVISFGEMILLKFIRRNENASDECLNVGLPMEVSERRLVRELGSALHGNADPDGRDEGLAHVKARICGWAIHAWCESHHGN